MGSAVVDDRLVDIIVLLLYDIQDTRNTLRDTQPSTLSLSSIHTQPGAKKAESIAKGSLRAVHAGFRWILALTGIENLRMRPVPHKESPRAGGMRISTVLLHTIQWWYSITRPTRTASFSHKGIDTFSTGRQAIARCNNHSAPMFSYPSLVLTRPLRRSTAIPLRPALSVLCVCVCLDLDTGLLAGRGQIK